MHQKNIYRSLVFAPLFFAITLFSGVFLSTTPAQAACSLPGQVLDLGNWKHTLPTGSKKKPTETTQPSLASFFHPTFFHLNDQCDGVVFRAPVNGVTTSGSGYPRSELREMTNGGKKLASWSTKSGTHTMIIDQAITAVPKNKKHVVAGQIHNGNDDVIVVRLEYPRLFVDINGKRGPTLDANYTLGKKFSVKFVATSGKIMVYYNGKETPVYTLKKKGDGNYFKAGAYAQSNCSKEKKSCGDSNYGEVVIYKLLVDHQSVANAVVPFSKVLASATDLPATEYEQVVQAERQAYQTDHDGFRERLLDRLIASAGTDASEKREAAARVVYTLLPDVIS